MESPEMAWEQHRPASQSADSSQSERGTTVIGDSPRATAQACISGVSFPSGPPSAPSATALRRTHTAASSSPEQHTSACVRHDPVPHSKPSAVEGKGFRSARRGPATGGADDAEGAVAAESADDDAPAAPPGSTSRTGRGSGPAPDTAPPLHATPAPKRAAKKRKTLPRATWSVSVSGMVRHCPRGEARVNEHSACFGSGDPDEGS